MSEIEPCYNFCSSSYSYLVLLSFFGGYGGYVPPHFGYGGGGIGLIILIVLIVMLLR